MDKKLLTFLILGMVFKLLFINHIVDDSYITYRYAENLVNGDGFVFNPGEKVLGITTPLYGLIISLGIFLGMSPITFSYIIALLCFSLILVLGYSFLKEKYGNLSSLAFATFLSFDHYTSRWFMSGMETALFSLVVFLSIMLMLKGKETASSLLGGLSIFIRPEGLFLVPLYFLFFKDKKKLIYGFLIYASYFISLSLFYGLAIPQSIKAKLLLGGGFSRLAETGYHLLNILIKQPFTAFLSVFMVSSPLLLIYPAAVFAMYLITQAPVFFWYYAPYYPLVFFAAASSFSRLKSYFKKNYSLFVLVFLLFYSIHQVAFGARELYLLDSDDLTLYKDFGLSINDPSAKIMIGDIGAVSYFSKAKIFDMAGLVTPKSIDCILEDRFIGCAREFNPDYFVVRKGTFQENLAASLGCDKPMGESRLHYFYSCRS